MTTRASPLAAGDARALREAGRDTYVDGLRALAVVFVVAGHWIATAIVYRPGHFDGVDVLGVVPWTSWLTLILQTVPLFFLVGGYANALSWQRHRADGDHWASWVRRRVLGLVVPASGYVLLTAAAVLGCQLAGVQRGELDQVGWALGLHLWFLAAYALVLLLVPLAHAAHRRWGLLVPVAMCAVAGGIDVGVVEAHWHLVGWTNYLLVWGAFHQIGFAWYDGTFGGRRTARRPAGLLVVAVAALWALIGWGPYPVSMVGVPGARIQNASPPSNALLAFGLAQVALAVALAVVVRPRIDRHRRLGRRLVRAGSYTMPVYLWHMAPVPLVTLLAYPTGLFHQPAIGSARWWLQRIAWVALLAGVLVLLLVVLAAARRVLHGLRPRGHRTDAPRSSPAAATMRVRTVPAAWLLALGVVATAYGFGRLAVDGFAPGGSVGVTSLAFLATGFLAVHGSARVTRSIRHGEGPYPMMET